MLDSQTAVTAAAPALAGLVDASLHPAPAPRGVVPRRPLRLAPPRDDSAPDPRQPLAAMNIFDDVFDLSPANYSETCLDPRIVASRRRARRHLGTGSADLAPDEANFWHESIRDTDPLHALPQGDATYSANDVPDLPAPLHEHLARVRAALYAEGLEDDARSLEQPSTQMRLATYAMNATLVVVALPVGAAVTTYSILRGANVRLSAQAMAIVASVLGIWHGGIEGLL